jgi:Leucine-rich repeat (LRR) protein
LLHSRLHLNRLEELPDRLLLRLINLSTLLALHYEIWAPFCNLNQLYCSDLSSNLLKQLTKNQFEGLTRLIVLHISHNKLKTIPESVFAGLKMLEDLDLSKNLLINIPEKTFQGLARQVHVS